MMQQLRFEDITLSRHGGSRNSTEAFERLKPNLISSRLQVLNLIRDSKFVGLSCKECAADLNVGMNVVSGRFTELKAAGLILKQGRREGSAVYITTEPKDKSCLVSLT
tara:strand:+ start:495 stop:818 length:324 start_codon:yes stop_codon:yes gene_type:complete